MIRPFLQNLLVTALCTLAVGGALKGCGRYIEEQAARGLEGPEPELVLPSRLGPAAEQTPPSLDELLERHQLRGAGLRRFRQALQPYVGAKVRWELRSWGGEVSHGGFLTPSGQQPERLPGKGVVGRVRMISPTLGPKADLGTVMDAGHPVVVCLALFPANDEDRFVRSDGEHAPARVQGLATVEGVIWGVTKGRDLWLHDCRVTGARKEKGY